MYSVLSLYLQVWTLEETMILLTSACKSDYGRLWELLPIKNQWSYHPNKMVKWGVHGNYRSPTSGNIMGGGGGLYLPFLVLKFDFYEI